MNYKMLFSIKSLVEDQKLSIVDRHYSNLGDVIEDILPRDNTGNIIHPILIGVDGPVVAGKTYCTEIVKEIASRHALNFHAVHYDWFMSSRSVRAKEIKNFRSENYDFEQYDQKASDNNRMQKLLSGLRSALISQDKRFFEYTIDSAYNRLSGECKDVISNSISTDSIVIVEGSGILNFKLCNFFDISIRLDVDDTEEIIKRLIERERHKNGNKLPHNFIKERFLSLDYHFDNYLRHRDRSYFNILIDTTDLNCPRLFIRSKK